MTVMIDLTGRVFSRLSVLRMNGRNKHGAICWLCVCDCGNETTVSGGQLTSGKTKSCGCLRFDSAVGFVHGKTNTPEFRIWSGMLARCSNPNVKSFKNYGARGISVCERWLDFELFLSDVGERPSLRHSIERIDCNGNYQPGNVKWATDVEQANNRRNTRFVTYKGERMSLANAVRCAGSVIHYESAWIRIKWGWPVERAVETPPTIERKKSRRAA